MNICILHGRMTSDPTIRTANSGTKIAGFSIAVDGMPNNDGTKNTDFIRCTAFGKSADLMERYFSKGKEILVEGNIRQNDYTDNNGTKHFGYVVMADNVGFGGSKAENAGNQQTAQKFDTVPQNGVPVGLNVDDFEEIISDGETPF